MMMMMMMMMMITTCSSKNSSLSKGYIYKKVFLIFIMNIYKICSRDISYFYAQAFLEGLFIVV